MDQEVGRQLARLNKGMMQVNLRLTKLTELVEGGSASAGSASAGSDAALEILLDLVEAVDRTLDAGAQPAPPKRWWAPWQAPVSTDLEGLRLARAQAVDQLARAGIVPSPRDGTVVPELHEVVDVRAGGPSGAIAATHRAGWHRRDGDARVPVRVAQVTAFQES